MTLTAFRKFVLIPKRMKAIYNVTKTQIAYDQRHYGDQSQFCQPITHLTLSERNINSKSGAKEADKDNFLWIKLLEWNFGFSSS